MGETNFSLETQTFRWRPKLFIGDTNFSLETPKFFVGDPNFLVKPQILLFHYETLSFSLETLKFSLESGDFRIIIGDPTFPFKAPPPPRLFRVYGTVVVIDHPFKGHSRLTNLIFKPSSKNLNSVIYVLYL